MIGEGVSGETIVVLTRAQVSSDLQGEVVILNFETGVYYGLDEVGSFVWHQLCQARTVGELKSAITAEYEVDPDRCESDLLELLHSLAAAGLIEMTEEGRR